ncbi:MAG TPA: 50S ribosomal protein L28 [Rhodospirillaceae bacterium]|nr:MAG: 50S ribosomal protein L28 [Alphaproteobacteria bacterium GWF2_58_20]HAU29512.1 50S ribosomal protein L28 [Rhodospirillaceae bacterium]
MARRCTITGKGVMFGNNVSHANNKTRRRFTPNIQNTSLFSETLGKMVRLHLSVHGIRTIEHCGGLDEYLVNAAPSKLIPDLKRIREQIIGIREQKAA